MNDRCICVPVNLTLTNEHFYLIASCARDLELSFDEVLRAVVNTSVRRHFEYAFASEEVQ